VTLCDVAYSALQTSMAPRFAKRPDWLRLL
jgi:hypothetical protein